MQPKTFAQYVEQAAKQAGSDAALGKIAGFADGSRIGAARRAEGPRLSELACIKLARFTGDDVCWVLTLAGHDEMAELLRGNVQPPQNDQIKAGLRQLQGLIRLALDSTGEDANGKTEGDQKTSRRVRSKVD